MLCNNACRKRVAFYSGQLHSPIQGDSLWCQTGDSADSCSSKCVMHTTFSSQGPHSRPSLAIQPVHICTLLLLLKTLATLACCNQTCITSNPISA